MPTGLLVLGALEIHLNEVSFNYIRFLYKLKIIFYKLYNLTAYLLNFLDDIRSNLSSISLSDQNEYICIFIDKICEFYKPNMFFKGIDNLSSSIKTRVKQKLT